MRRLMIPCVPLMPRLPVVRHVWPALAAAAAVTLLSPQPAGSVEPEPVRQHSVQLHVTDHEGFPIGGARARPYALKSKTGTEAVQVSVDEIPLERVSDDDGLLTLAYPGMTAAGHPTTGCDVVVEHPRYVMSRKALTANDKAADIQLRRGRRLAVSAVREETGEPVRENLYAVLSGNSVLDSWKRYANGMLLSPTVATGRARLRVVYLPEDGSPEFSDIIKPGDYGHGARVLIRDIRVAAGTRLIGRLSDDVPRPVQNGYVAAVATHHAGMRDRHRRLEWEDWTQIESDGTFELPSLPRDGFVQLFAWCDGWVSSSPASRDLENAGLAEFRGELGKDGSRLPHVFRLGKPERSCEISMEQTARCVIQTETADGTPIQDAHVTVTANQRWLSGDSQPVGSGFSRRRFLRLSREQQLQPGSGGEQPLAPSGVLPPTGGRIQQTTDAGGRAEISQLPAGSAEAARQVQITVAHPDFRRSDTDLSAVVTVFLTHGRTANVTVTLIPREADRVE